MEFAEVDGRDGLLKWLDAKLTELASADMRGAHFEAYAAILDEAQQLAEYGPPGSFAVLGGPLPPTYDENAEEVYGHLRVLLVKKLQRLQTHLTSGKYTWAGGDIEFETPVQEGGPKPFVPGANQRAILTALKGRALKKDALADVAFGGDGSRLYKKKNTTSKS